MTRDNHEQGLFEGEIRARLDTMEARYERNSGILFAKLDRMEEKITGLRIEAGIGKGLVSIIAILVSGATTLLVSWFKAKV